MEHVGERASGWVGRASERAGERAGEQERDREPWVCQSSSRLQYQTPSSRLPLAIRRWHDHYSREKCCISRHKLRPPAAGFIHEERHCQDVRVEGNAGVSRWNVWFTPNHAAGISISYHFGTIIFSRKFLWHFFSRENSCSSYFLEKNHVTIVFSRKFL